MTVVAPVGDEFLHEPPVEAPLCLRHSDEEDVLGLGGQRVPQHDVASSGGDILVNISYCGNLCLGREMSRYPVVSIGPPPAG